jgi:hypothetical protein
MISLPLTFFLCDLTEHNDRFADPYGCRKLHAAATAVASANTRECSAVDAINLMDASLLV